MVADQKTNYKKYTHYTSEKITAQTLRPQLFTKKEV